jgi:hypothetical protein
MPTIPTHAVTRLNTLPASIASPINKVPMLDRKNPMKAPRLKDRIFLF